MVHSKRRNRLEWIAMVHSFLFIALVDRSLIQTSVGVLEAPTFRWAAKHAKLLHHRDRGGVE